MAYSNKPYTTVDAVKALYQSTSTTKDDLIQSLIPVAQEKVDAYVGFPFQTDGPSAVRTYDGNGAAQLLIDRCQTLVSVQIQTYSFGTDPTTGALTRTANPVTDITVGVVLGPPNASPQYLLQHLFDTFPLGTRNIVVTGTFGFTTVPQQVQQACALEVIAMLDASNRGYRTTIASPTGTGTSSKPDDICEAAKELLSSFKRVRFRMS